MTEQSLSSAVAGLTYSNSEQGEAVDIEGNEF